MEYQSQYPRGGNYHNDPYAESKSYSDDDEGGGVGGYMNRIEQGNKNDEDSESDYVSSDNEDQLGYSYYKMFNGDTLGRHIKRHLLLFGMFFFCEGVVFLILSILEDQSYYFSQSIFVNPNGHYFQGTRWILAILGIIVGLLYFVAIHMWFTLTSNRELLILILQTLQVFLVVFFGICLWCVCSFFISFRKVNFQDPDIAVLVFPLYISTIVFLLPYLLGIVYHILSISNYADDVERGMTIQEPDISPDHRHRHRDLSEMDMDRVLYHPMNRWIEHKQSQITTTAVAITKLRCRDICACFVYIFALPVILFSMVNETRRKPRHYRRRRDHPLPSAPPLNQSGDTIGTVASGGGGDSLSHTHRRKVKKIRPPTSLLNKTITSTTDWFTHVRKYGFNNRTKRRHTGNNRYQVDEHDTHHHHHVDGNNVTILHRMEQNNANYDDDNIRGGVSDKNGISNKSIDSQNPNASSSSSSMKTKPFIVTSALYNKRYLSAPYNNQIHPSTALNDDDDDDDERKNDSDFVHNSNSNHMKQRTLTRTADTVLSQSQSVFSSASNNNNDNKNNNNNSNNDKLLPPLQQQSSSSSSRLSGSTVDTVVTGGTALLTRVNEEEDDDEEKTSNGHDDEEEENYFASDENENKKTISKNGRDSNSNNNSNNNSISTRKKSLQSKTAVAVDAIDHKDKNIDDTDIKKINVSEEIADDNERIKQTQQDDDEEMKISHTNNSNTTTAAAVNNTSAAAAEGERLRFRRASEDSGYDYVIDSHEPSFLLLPTTTTSATTTPSTSINSATNTNTPPSSSSSSSSQQQPVARKASVSKSGTGVGKRGSTGAVFTAPASLPPISTTTTTTPMNAPIITTTSTNSSMANNDDANISIDIEKDGLKKKKLYKSNDDTDDFSDNDDDDDDDAGISGTSKSVNKKIKNKSKNKKNDDNDDNKVIPDKESYSYHDEYDDLHADGGHNQNNKHNNNNNSMTTSSTPTTPTPTHSITLSVIEFKALWAQLSVTNSFQCKLEIMPDIITVTEHFKQQGFHIVFATTGKSNLNEIELGICNKRSISKDFWFMARFLMINNNFSAVMKCQNPSELPGYIKKYELTKILKIET